jgi:DNA-directed RNA polymerase specialized sigma subunit
MNSLPNKMLSNIEFFKQQATLHRKLSKEAQTQLFLNWRDRGCTYSRDNLLYSCYGLNIRECAKKSYDYMLSLDELLAITVIAQHHALRKYNPDAGSAFSSYQLTWVRNYLLTDLKRSKVVALPNHISLRDAPQRVAFSREGGEYELEFTSEDLELGYRMDTKKPLQLTSRSRTKSKAVFEQPSFLSF